MPKRELPFGAVAGAGSVVLLALSLAIGVDTEAARRRAIRHPSPDPPPVLTFYGDYGILANVNNPPMTLGLPANSFTLESWVRIERYHPEGSSLIGLQANQSGSIGM